MWWTAEVDQLLRDWRNRAYAAQTGHYVMTTRLRRWNYLLGVPVVVLTSVIGTSIFANLGNQAPPIWVRIAAGVVSLLAAVLSGLQTFFTFGETASLHSGAAAWYSAIRRDIEGLLALPPERRGDPKTSIESIRKEMNKVGQTAPELNERLWAGLARRFNVKEPPPND
jgi:hypothetical protein